MGYPQRRSAAYHCVSDLPIALSEILFQPGENIECTMLLQNILHVPCDISQEVGL